MLLHIAKQFVYLDELLSGTEDPIRKVSFVFDSLVF